MLPNAYFRRYDHFSRASFARSRTRDGALPHHRHRRAECICVAPRHRSPQPNCVGGCARLRRVRRSADPGRSARDRRGHRSGTRRAGGHPHPGLGVFAGLRGDGCGAGVSASCTRRLRCRAEARDGLCGHHRGGLHVAQPPRLPRHRCAARFCRQPAGC